MSIRMKAFDLVLHERFRQDSKWGEQNLPPELWATILGDEYGEFCEAVRGTVWSEGPKGEKGGRENMMIELTHVAAVAVAAMECLMRNEEETRV